MSEAFDPYLNWLGIRDPKRPPNHYRLLGIDLFESDPEIISVAADRQMAHVRTFQTGKHSAISQRLLNEIAAAKLCLLNPAKKAEYDALLRAEEAARTSALAPPVAAPPPLAFPAPPVAVPPEIASPLPVPEGSGLSFQVGGPRQSVVPPGGPVAWPPPGQRSGGLATGLAPGLPGAGAAPAGAYAVQTEAPPVAPPLPGYDLAAAATAPPAPAGHGRLAHRQRDLLLVVFLGALILGLAAGLVWLRTHNSAMRVAGPVADDGGDQQDAQQTDQPQPAEQPGDGSQVPPKIEQSQQPPSPISPPSQQPPSQQPPSQQPPSEPPPLTPPTSQPEPMEPSEQPDQSKPQPQTEPEPQPKPVEPPKPEPPTGPTEQPPTVPEPTPLPKSDPEPPSGSNVESGRLPIPSAEQQAKSQKEIRDLLRREYELAGKDIKEKKLLANKLWKLARETNDDPVARFVLYCEARDEAAEAGEGALFLRVIEAMGRQYGVDELKTAAAALQRAVKNLRDPAAQKAIVEVGVQLARRANSQENYEAARVLAETARDIARKTRDLALVRQAATALQEVEAYARLFADFSKAEAVLSEHPEDPQANFLAGRYYCFVRNQWQRGLPLLAKGSNEQLRDLALVELSGPEEPKQKVDLADRWRAAAETAEEMFQRFYYDRARHWYRNALPGLTGLDRARVEKQLEELKKQLAPK